jgi:ATP-binding cassette subfamily B protein
MHAYLRLLGYARRQRGFLILAFLLALLTSGLTALQPWPMKLLFDHVLDNLPRSSWLNHIVPNSTQLLPFIVLGGLLLFVFYSAVDAALAWIWTSNGRRMVYDLATDLFSRLQRRSLLFHKRTPVGDTMGRVTVDSWCVYQLVDTLIFAPGSALLTMAAMIVLMAHLDLSMTCVSVAVAPFMVGATFLVGKPLRLAARLKREIETRIQSHIQQTLTGIPVVQAFGQEDRERQRFESFAEAVIRTQQRTALLGSVNSLSTGLITTLGSGVVLWMGARHVLAGQLSIGGILVFLVYLGSLQAQMKVVAGLYTTLQGLSANVHRVLEVLDTAPEIIDSPQAVPVQEIRGHVRFEAVTFGYEPNQPVLKAITFEAQPGQVIAIVGATGAGKSSLVNLIPRFADPWLGRILIDGQDVRQLRLEDLRANVSIVFQEIFLLPLTVAENIAFGRPAATREEIQQAAVDARADDFITALPEGYDTVLGEHGGTISGGERQRISIARAFLKNAPILILDEPTSSLDAITEGKILDALDRLMRNRTTFVIAHRLSTVRRADRILVMENGSIIESGTHEELLLSSGTYSRLHSLQFGSRSEATLAR